MSRAAQSIARNVTFVGGKKNPLYTLEFLTTTPDYAAGSRVSVAAPYLEIGRGDNCALRFSEAVRTVSRKHAALERRGTDIVVYNLSSTNPTLVNGSPVEKNWVLRDGDEIQLSYEGPQLRFLSAGTPRPRVNQSSGLADKQAVHPYRMVLWIAIIALVVGALVAAYYLTSG